MKKTAISKSRNWNVSLIKLNKKLFKVTKNNPTYSINETECFNNKKEAIRKFNNWLSQ